MNNFKIFGIISYFLVAESKADVTSKSNLHDQNSVKDNRFWGSWFDPFDLGARRKAAAEEAAAKVAVAKAEAAKAEVAKAEAEASMSRSSSGYSYGSRSMSSARKYGF